MKKLLLVLFSPVLVPLGMILLAKQAEENRRKLGNLLHAKRMADRLTPKFRG